LKKYEHPAIVPPVPATDTNMSISLFVYDHISGAVPSI